MDVPEDEGLVGGVDDQAVPQDDHVVIQAEHAVVFVKVDRVPEAQALAEGLGDVAGLVVVETGAAGVFGDTGDDPQRVFVRLAKNHGQTYDGAIVTFPGQD
jgi:hypothetical protein